MSATSHTRVPRWTPSLLEAIRLAWRPALAYNIFNGLGSAVLFLTVAWYAQKDGSSREVIPIFLGTIAGTIGILLGQLISLLRFRALPVFIVTGFCAMIVAWMAAQTNPPGGDYIGIPALFFLFAFPCGLLSLMHRYELFASFWPAVGWIGGVFVIINNEQRVTAWHQNKVSAWLPVPLLYLAGFLLFWLFYLAAKQASRVEMWQALSGAVGRRVAKKENRVGALPRRNILPILFVAIVLFAVTAVLAPYLWRTGRADHAKGTTTTEEREPKRDGPSINGEGIARELQKIANAAKNTLPKLWPLLLLIVLYRPAKRALLLTHLKAPITPTPPSERIDNLWEYIRIAAEDAGVVPTSADSVEQLLKRIHETGRSSPALAQAAEIYIRTRYGFTVKRGDAVLMRTQTSEAATVLRKDLGVWTHFKNWWRPLS